MSDAENTPPTSTVVPATDEPSTAAPAPTETITTATSENQRKRARSASVDGEKSGDSPSQSKKINLDPAAASTTEASASASASTPSADANGGEPTSGTVQNLETDIVNGGQAQAQAQAQGKKMEVDQNETTTTQVVDRNGPETATSAIPTTEDVSMTEANEAANPAPTPNQQIQMKALIVTQDASIIIGKQGKHIHEIREKAGARINVSEAIPGNQERILNVGGPLDAVSKAFGLIVRRINDEPFDVPSVPGSRAVNIRFIIPNSRMGSVIGKAGSKIKEIQDASGARLQASEAMLPGSTERVLTVSGVADAIHIAVYYIGTILLEGSDRAGSNTAYRQQQGGPRGGRDSYAPSQGGYSNYGVGGGGGAPMPNPSTVPGSQTQQIFIPNELVGSIIGKGGQKINEIRQLSQCQIKIMEPQESGVAQTGERLVLITGLPPHIERAIQLLSMRLDAEKAKLSGATGY